MYFSDTKAVLKDVPDGTIMLAKSIPGAYVGMAVRPYNPNEKKEEKSKKPASTTK